MPAFAKTTSAHRSVAAKVPTPGGGGGIDTKPVISTVALPGGTVGVAYSGAVSASGPGSVTLAATGLPSGLSMSSAGAITGTPTTAGSYDVTVTPTSSTSGAGDAVEYVVVIAAAPTVDTSGINGPWAAIVRGAGAFSR